VLEMGRNSVKPSTKPITAAFSNNTLSIPTPLIWRSATARHYRRDPAKALRERPKIAG
jgi:hypothetical protein